MSALELWTIYDHPTDYPEHFVARKFLNDQPTDDITLSTTLAGLRSLLPQGLYRMERHPTDDPKIVETWF